MAKKEVTVEEKLRALYDLQLIDSRIDEITAIRGELPLEVEDLQDEVEGLQTRLEKLKSDLSTVDDSIKAKKESLNHFDVPICNSCQEKKLASFYRKNRKVSFHSDYIINPIIQKPETRFCDFCGDGYDTSSLFENFGFSKNVCPDCLKNNEINLLLSNKFLEPIWRNRK